MALVVVLSCASIWRYNSTFSHRTGGLSDAFSNKTGSE